MWKLRFGASELRVAFEGSNNWARGFNANAHLHTHEEAAASVCQFGTSNYEVQFEIASFLEERRRQDSVKSALSENNYLN